MWEPVRRLLWTLTAAFLGLVGGFIGRVAVENSRPAVFLPSDIDYIPLPHQIPKYRGGVSFRFAMVHDVIHERFPRHGPAHYRERNRLTHKKLARLAPDDPATFPLADDLGAGLERLGQSLEGAEVIRARFERQKALGLKGRDLYTSYANLGTFLIHGHFKKAIAGDAEARARYREGVELVRKSVEVNPEAHFGREQWQVVVAEFLLAVTGKPDLLRTFDCIGNRLDRSIEEIFDPKKQRPGPGVGRPTSRGFEWGGATTLKLALEVGQQCDDPALWNDLIRFRSEVTPVGAEDGWKELPIRSHQTPVPFDEPMLGFIGMWRQGGGANPHFALSMGETMLRVGQRYIAWAAFERTHRLADRYWPDPAIQQFLRDHCRKRQKEIEESLTFRSPDPDTRPWQYVSPPPPEGTVAGLRVHFDGELAHGQAFQRAYQRYEEEKMAAGVPISDEHFFDDFFADRAPIASPSGSEEWFAKGNEYPRIGRMVHRVWAWDVFSAGLLALLTACWLRPRP